MQSASRTVAVIAAGALVLSLTGFTFWSTQSALAWDGPGGDQGCTPGYWKQKQHFDSWPVDTTYIAGGVNPSTPLANVIGFEVPGFEGITMLEALQLNGGGAKALLRQGAAGILNALSTEVDYNMSLETAIRNIEDGLDPLVFQSSTYGDDDDLEQRKNFLEAANEQVCPLN